MKLPYYWKRGLLAGIVIWLVLGFLVSHLEKRQELMDSNVPVAQKPAARPPMKQTDFGSFLGVLIFALFCAVPGPDFGRSAPAQPTAHDATRKSEHAG